MRPPRVQRGRFACSDPSSATSITTPPAARLANEGGRAFVSQSLRPFVVAALADQDARRPALVVVGDDRAARDLAGDLRAWLHPRPVRYYPSRGVAYESHLTPPPHLVGLRVAALDAHDGHARGLRAAGRRDQRDRAEREGPRPEAAPARLRAARRRPASTSTRPRRTSSPPATSASTRSRTAASSRSAAACSTSTRRPRSAPSASTCSTSRSRPCAGSRPSPSAAWGRPTASRSRPPPSSRPSTARWPRSPPATRRRIAPTSPTCCRSTSSARCWTCSPSARR